MADQIEMQNIRGLDIDKTAKGFADREYVFKGDCLVSSTSADHIRWYSKTAGTLTATSPQTGANIGALSTFPNLEASWTRNTSYVKKYGFQVMISEEDIDSADIDVLATHVRDVTRAVVALVDADIWDVMTESQSPSNINDITSTAAWDAESGQDPIEDILEALQKIEEQDYSTAGAVLYLSPKDKKSLLTWLISTKGSSIPQFASEKVKSGEIMQIAGVRVKVSNNVTADYAAVAIPNAVTFKQHTPTTARVIEDAGIGKMIRVWERGIAYLTDPKKISLISNTQA